MTGEATSATTSLTRVGQYELVRPLAHGGMADVYLARRGAGGPHVALKVLNARRADDEEACSLFLDEARVVALLDHPNVASVLDVDIADDQIYLAMELVHGTDLRGLLAACMTANRALPYATAVAIVSAAAAGLDHAHRRCSPDGKPLRLVHRDVSLSNIMVGHDGIVKVVDFGIASTTIGTVHTCPGVVRGKASYMSPEQCLGEHVDHRSDVFALGVVLYELTTGARCFAGQTDFDRMLAIVRGELVAPSVRVPDYPIELEQVVRAALATDPGQRFPSAAALIEALDRIARGAGWATGRAAIAPLMRELFGDVPPPWADAPAAAADLPIPHGDLAGDTVRSEPISISPPVTPALARGSRTDLLAPDGWTRPDSDDEPTRGRRSVRRPPMSPLAT